MLKQLKHDNIVNLGHVFRDEDRICLVFEHVERTVLQDIDDCPNGLRPDAVKSIMFQMIKAITFMHSHEVLHRDIKPENLLLSHNGVLKLCDFGFARSETREGIYTDYVSTRW